MAQDIFTLNIDLGIKGPEYKLKSGDDWEKHFHGNKDLKRDLTAAVIEQLQAVLPMVVVNGEKFSVVISDHDEVRTKDIEMTVDEQAIVKKAYSDKEKGWEIFHDEVDRRVKRDGISLSVYSMGDLYGSPDQLNEVVGQGPHMVVIDNGWG